MAKLPAPEDIQRARMPAATPGINVRLPDYEVQAKATQAYAAALGGSKDRPGLAQGLNALSVALEKGQDEVDDYETKKKLLDFQLNAEMALEERKRNMPIGAQGYAEGWQNDFKGMAADFVGKNDANIPASQRAKVGLALKRIDTQLAERATRDQFAEQDRFELDGLNETTNRLRSSVEADPGRLDEMRNEGRSLIELSRLTPAAKHKALQTYEKEIEKTYFISRMGRVQTKEDLDALKDELGPDLPDKRISVTPKGRSRMSQANSEVAAQAFQFFLNKGLDANKAAAIAANMSWEGGGKSDLVNPGDNYKNSPRAPHSAGIAQWNDRLPAAIQFWKSQGIEVPDGDLRDANYVRRMIKAIPLEAQLEWTWHEMNTSERAALGRIQASGDLPGAVAGAIGYHRPAGWSAGNPTAGHGYRDRLSIASEILNNYGIEGSVPGGAGEGYSGPGSRLSITERKAYWNQAQTEWQKQIVGLDKEIGNFEKVAGDGYTLPDGILGDLQKRVEATGDPTLQSRFRATLGLAAESQRLQQMPPPLLEQYTQNLRRNASEKGVTPEQEKYIAHAEKISATVRKNTSEDPLSWAQRTGIKLPIVAGQGPDGFSEPLKLEQMNFGAKDIDAVLARRMEQAKIVGSYYGQEPQAFTKIERDALKATLKQGGDAMLHVMGKIAKSAGEAGLPPEQVMKEFTKDAPEVAMIGDLVANNADKNLLNTAAKALAWKTSQKENFKPTIDRAMVKPDIGEYAEALKTQPTKVDAVRDTAALIYEYESRQKGKTEFDHDLYKDIVGRVMGKVTTPDGLSYGGVGKQGSGWFDGKWQTQVLVPPGIRTDMFDDMVGALRTSDFAYIGTPRTKSGNPIPIDKVRGATWVSVGPGQYELHLGQTPAGENKIAFDERGKPFVLDVRKMMDPLRRRKPDLFMGYDGVTPGVE